MIKAIVFDCFGVLTTDSWREFVASLPEAQQRTASDLNRAYGGAQIDKASFLREIQSLTGRQPQDIDDLLDHETTKNTPLLDFIGELKTDYKISMLSNIGSNWVRDSFLTAEEQALFDDFVLSYEVRITKPNPAIFEMAAGRLGVETSECVLIDDVEYYCEVARETGMQAIWYDDFNQAQRELETLLAANTEG